MTTTQKVCQVTASTVLALLIFIAPLLIVASLTGGAS